MTEKSTMELFILNLIPGQRSSRLPSTGISPSVVVGHAHCQSLLQIVVQSWMLVQVPKESSVFHDMQEQQGLAAGRP